MVAVAFRSQRLLGVAFGDGCPRSASIEETVKVPRFLRKGRTTCSLILFWSLLAGRWVPAAGAAPPGGLTTPDPVVAVAGLKDPASKPPKPLNAVPARAVKPLSLELPSAVSSDIERFVKQSGRDVSQPSRSPSTPTAVAARASRPDAALRPAFPAAPPPLAPPRAQSSGRPGSSPPSPLATIPTLKAAPHAPEDRRFPINFATTLRLADARPLIVAAAQARVWIAEAELTRAKVLWLPELNIGFDYIRHDGGGPDFAKSVLTTPSVNFFYAGGGLYGVLALDRRHLRTAGGASSAQRQALGYPGGEKRRPACKPPTLTFSSTNIEASTPAPSTPSALPANWSKRSRNSDATWSPAYEVDRARNMVADLQQQAVSARQQWRVQSAG